MARVTIERALQYCESRFELVVLLSYRAHEIAFGSETAVQADNKFAVMAVRELEAGKINIDELRDTVIKKYAMESKFNVAKNSFVINDYSTENNEENDDEVDNLDVKSLSTSESTTKVGRKKKDNDLNLPSNYFSSNED